MKKETGVLFQSLGGVLTLSLRAQRGNLIRKKQHFSFRDHHVTALPAMTQERRRAQAAFFNKEDNPSFSLEEKGTALLSLV